MCCQHFPDVEVLLDVGLPPEPRPPRASDHTTQKAASGALPGRVQQWKRDRHGHSSDRITWEVLRPRAGGSCCCIRASGR